MNKEQIDQPHAVRAGEELDTTRLAAYLSAQLPQLGLTIEGPLTVEQFQHGFSNLTYLVKTRAGGLELVLRRPPFGVEIKSAHDMEREYRVLDGLIKVYPRVPRPILYCNDLSVMDVPFYLMERVKGIVLRTTTSEELGLSPEMMRKLSEAFTDNLTDIHSADYVAAGLENLGRPEGYIQRQLTGWTQRYQRSKTDDIPEVEQVSEWLLAHALPDSGPTIIHNDYKYDNMILDTANLTNIKAVLDWEMATIGDPLMDLGTSLAYWVEARDLEELQATRFSPTTLLGNLSRAELVQRYAERSGRDVSNIVFYYAFGLFKIAVVSQQLYMRYKKGFTTDPRYERTLFSVGALTRAALRAIEKDQL